MAGLSTAEAVIPVTPDTSDFGRQLTAGTRGALRDAERTIGTSMDRAMTRTGGNMKSLGRKATMGVTMPLVAGFAMLSQSVMDYDEAVRRAVTLEGLDDSAANDALEDTIRGQIDAAREKWAVGGTEAANAYFTGVSGGLGDNGSAEMKKALDSAAQLAIAGNTTIDASMSLLVRAAQTFPAVNLSAAEAADTYVAAANESLVSLDEMAPALSQAGSAAAGAGVPLAEMSAAMSTLSMSMELGSASAGLKGIFTEMNREGTDLNDTLKDMGHDTVSSAIEEFGSFQQVMEAMFQSTGASEVGFKNLFGQAEAADAALLLVGQNAPGALDALENVREGAGSATRAAKTMMEGEAFQIRKMMEELSAAMEPVVRDLLPQVIEIAEDLLPIVADIAEFMAELSDKTNGWGLVALAAFGPVTSGLGTILQLVGNRGIAGKLAKLAPAASTAGTGMAAGLAPAIAAAGKLSIAVGAGIAAYKGQRWLNEKTGWDDMVKRNIHDLGGAGGEVLDDLGGFLDGIGADKLFGMSEGGTVHPDGRISNGGGRIVALGDGGEREHAVPESKADAFAASRLGGGGGVTVNANISINAQGPIDEVAVRKLAPTVAAELDRITRSRTARKRP